MSSPDKDTIAAIATPPGTGGVGVVRISGSAVPGMVNLLIGTELQPRRARYAAFLDASGAPIDRGIALYFEAPASFTGEHVLELHGHGGPVVMQLLLQRTLELGARPARPGEFSERAFLNDKLDLAQAEAVADLISSATETAARAARRSMDGEFSRRVQTLQQQVTDARTHVEAAIDFPEEEIDFLADGAIAKRVRGALTTLNELRRAARQGRLLRDGLSLALVGRPNVGKSSLLNALSGREAAIVTAIPGTTRDVLREQIQLDGIPLHLVDTAGLREGADEVEREGVRRARRELAAADHILVIVDQSDPQSRPEHLDLPADLPLTEVHNKIDLSGDQPRLESEDGTSQVYLSALTGAGLDLLKAHLKTVAGVEEAGEGQFLARTRHLDALARVHEHLSLGLERLEKDRAGELLAEELRLAQQALSEITGEFTTEDLLGEIFSSFCIGK